MHKCYILLVVFTPPTYEILESLTPFLLYILKELICLITKDWEIIQVHFHSKLRSCLGDIPIYCLGRLFKLALWFLVFWKPRWGVPGYLARFLSHCAVRQTYVELWNKPKPFLGLGTYGPSEDVGHGHYHILKNLILKICRCIAKMVNLWLSLGSRQEPFWLNVEFLDCW